jgi:hypothetical protein
VGGGDKMMRSDRRAEEVAPLTLKLPAAISEIAVWCSRIVRRVARAEEDDCALIKGSSEEQTDEDYWF